MRLFVALPVPEGPRVALADRSREARRDLPPARWVAPETLHLTLVFLGERDPSDVDALDDLLAPAFASVAPFSAHLTGGGVFPENRHGRRPRPARVAWVGVEGGDALPRLQRRVADALRGLVEEEDTGRRSFHPHLTLARCKAPWREEAVERFLRHFPVPKREHGWGEPFEVEHGCLFESHLTPHEARHHEVSVYPLGPGFGGAEAAVSEAVGA